MSVGSRQTVSRQCETCTACLLTWLQNKGYCKWEGNCRQFPIVIGETGSFLHDPRDNQWMQVSSPSSLVFLLPSAKHHVCGRILALRWSTLVSPACTQSNLQRLIAGSKLLAFDQQQACPWILAQAYTPALPVLTCHNMCLQDFADFVEGRGQARTYTSAPMAGWLW
jgi:hypothetical protein